MKQLFLPLICICMLSCADECEDCPKKFRKIVIDEVDTALVTNGGVISARLLDSIYIGFAQRVVIDEVDTARVKNVDFMAVENSKVLHIENSDFTIIVDPKRLIIVNGSDTTYVPSTN